jgi:hypothetical protein
VRIRRSGARQRSVRRVFETALFETHLSGVTSEPIARYRTLMRWGWSGGSGRSGDVGRVLVGSQSPPEATDVKDTKTDFELARPPIMRG